MESYGHAVGAGQGPHHTVTRLDDPLGAGQDRTIRIWSLPAALTAASGNALGRGNSSAAAAAVARQARRAALPREAVRIRGLSSSVVAADFTEDGGRVVALLARHQLGLWDALKGTPMCSWDFMPVDAAAHAASPWRTGSLALTRALNAAVVADSAGNTFTFALLAITSASVDADDC